MERKVVSQFLFKMEINIQENSSTRNIMEEANTISNNPIWCIKDNSEMENNTVKEYFLIPQPEKLSIKVYGNSRWNMEAEHIIIILISTIMEIGLKIKNKEMGFSHLGKALITDSGREIELQAEETSKQKMALSLKVYFGIINLFQEL